MIFFFFFLFYSSWLTSQGEFRLSACFSASLARSCSVSCSLVGMEFFFGRPLGLVGDSRPPPCNTWKTKGYSRIKPRLKVPDTRALSYCESYRLADITLKIITRIKTIFYVSSISTPGLGGSQLEQLTAGLNHDLGCIYCF